VILTVPWKYQALLQQTIWSRMVFNLE